MKVVIMGCGRVGLELCIELAHEGHEVTVIDKDKAAFDLLPPGFEARTIVGLGFDRDILEEAGIKEADAFLAVSSGDNSNIVSARVAREHYHVPRVIARINDPRRADIYERLNIPTIAPVRWGVRQAMLMLLHEGQDTQDSFAGGELLRVRVDVPTHLVGRPVSQLAEEGRVLVGGVERGGAAFVPSTNSTFQQGDVVQLILHRDALEGLEGLLTFMEEE